MRFRTAPAIGKVYQVATAPTTDSVISICSGPLTTEDNASDERIANPLNFDILRILVLYF